MGKGWPIINGPGNNDPVPRLTSHRRFTPALGELGKACESGMGEYVQDLRLGEFLKQDTKSINDKDLTPRVCQWKNEAG
jgi:hypothetical protein